ncbi:forkhead-associated protein [Streptomyces spongiicola]|uniref:Forkhead-associated protein n=1 Tax=Streptomyces spongiicola TaxID=1690221 RepID=A0ABM6V4I0_9ACTN|nr:FHA domain-containing protein [Streptomyces spongiicola]AWK08705.1 forkhead-associated protein [Streptomyces spongiicola]
MPTCPNGHRSGSDDWCEVCGHRMAGAGAPAGAVPPPAPAPPPAPGYGYPGPGDPNATAQAELCPQCRTPREPMAPFCEECRWNFLTNTATSYTPVAPPHRPGPGDPPSGLDLPPGFQAQQPRPQDPFEYQGSRPSQMNRPAEPLGGEPPAPRPPHGGPPPPPAPPPPFPGPYPGPGTSGSEDVSESPGQQRPAGPPEFSRPAAQPQYGYPSGPPAPPGFPQAVPAPPQQPLSAGDDDWMLSPPPPPQPHAQQPHAQQRPGGQQHPAPPPQQSPYEPAGWTVAIAPDREYFMAMMQRSGPEAAGLNLPAYSPEQQLALSGDQITIGRRRHSTGESPDIDLSVPPEDPGVSHKHALLIQQPDGSWAVVDQNSTNGTTVNGAEDPIQPYVPVPLRDGDRVHVGAWTTITIRRG